MFNTKFATDGRDNNFQLLRLLAATSVVFAHSFSIASGDATSEPLIGLTGRSLGNFAVDAFFIMSGFLIGQSIAQHPDLVRFWVGRLLRIFPALVCAVFATTFLLGPAVSTLPFSEYFSDIALLKYLVGAVTTLSVTQPLPGVFTQVPDANIVNLPLWTLKYELGAYASLAVLSAIFAVWRIKSVWLIGVAMAVFFVVARQFLPWTLLEGGTLNNLLHLFACFFVGVALYRLRDKIPLNIVGVLVMGGLYAMVFTTPAREVFEILFIGYAVFWFAFVPHMFRETINSIGDYSYGIYIFAFPIQQTLMLVFAFASPFALFFAAMAFTLPLAMLSWHFIEAPCLGKRRAVTGFVRSKLGLRLQPAVVAERLDGRHV